MTKLVQILIVISLPILMADISHYYASIFAAVGLDTYATIAGCTPFIVLLLSIAVFALKILKPWMKILLVYGISVVLLVISNQLFIKGVDSMKLDNVGFPPLKVIKRIDDKIQTDAIWKLSTENNPIIYYQKGLIDREVIFKALKENGLELKR